MYAIITQEINRLNIDQTKVHDTFANIQDFFKTNWVMKMTNVDTWPILILL